MGDRDEAEWLVLGADGLSVGTEGVIIGSVLRIFQLSGLTTSIIVSLVVLMICRFFRRRRRRLTTHSATFACDQRQQKRATSCLLPRLPCPQRHRC